jgi:hypothetical protein
MSDKRRSGKGNPNPSPATRFGAGNNANPAGKTSEQKRAEMKAGEIAAQIQLRMLQALSEAVSDDNAAALQAIAADPLRLIKDAMDREFGTAVQKSDHTSSDGSMTPKPTVIEFIAPKAADESDD